MHIPLPERNGNAFAIKGSFRLLMHIKKYGPIHCRLYPHPQEHIDRTIVMLFHVHFGRFGFLTRMYGPSA